MKLYPILFNGAMVRAILAGNKTQTRRVIRPQPGTYSSHPGDTHHGNAWMPDGGVHRENWRCPYGQPGDRLWVRETFCKITEPTASHSTGIAYRADNWSNCPADDGKWKPSIFCRREESRITLEIVAVRVERLQEITEADAVAEGCPPFETGGEVQRDGTVTPLVLSARWCYKGRWFYTHTYGPGSWAANPWVWVIEFKRHRVRRAHVARGETNRRDPSVLYRKIRHLV